MPERKVGHNCVCKIDDDNNGSYTAVAQVLSVDGANGFVPGEIDATVIDDAISPYMIPMTVDEIPPVTLELAYDPNASTHATLKTLTTAHTSFGLQLVMANYSTTKTWTCATGYISNYQMGPVNSRGLMTLKIIYRPQAIPAIT